jgi:hypothetical protein
MINRLRMILPADSVVVAVVLVFAFAEGPFLFLEWRIQQPLDIPRPGLLVVRLLAVLYGCWRFSAFHPAFHTDYRDWLARSPWNYKKPLPSGPVNLVWEDLLPISGLAIMAAFFGPIVPLRVLSLFLCGYLATSILATFSTGTRVFGYLVAFGIGLAIRLWPTPELALGILAATYVIEMIGLRRALAKFPWAYFSDPDRIENLQRKLENACGWPFDQLNPTWKLGWRISRLDGLALGLLAGWFLFAVESLVENRADRFILVRLIFLGGVGIMANIRLLTYVMGYAPPISLLGRIRTFRWIIPGYDQVFLGPICTLLVGVLAIDRFRPPGLNDLVFLPIALALAITVAIDTGPTLKKWRLTGQHRITTTSSTVNGEFVKVG